MARLSPRSKLSLTFILVALLALLGLLSAGASALPGDQPIAALTPADGASEPAVEEGLKVSYTCPSYRQAEEEEKGEEEGEEKPPVVIVTKGTVENYGVVFSTGNALGKDGRLVSAGFGEAGTAEAEAVKGTANCTSELELPTVPNPPALYGGRVYWQPYRECEGCASGFEVGPVRSFVVVPTDEEAEITFESHVFGGYMTKVSFAGEAGLKGARVALQRWTGTAWETIAEELGTALGENSFYVTLGAGHKLLRPVVLGAGGASLVLEEKAKTVSKPKQHFRVPVRFYNWEPVSWQQELPLDFQIRKDGTLMTGFSATVEAICKGPTKGQKVTIEARSTVPKVKIAPDGSVVAHFTTTGATPSTVTLTGRFFSNRFSGLLTSSFLNCFGFREFEAAPGTEAPNHG